MTDLCNYPKNYLELQKELKTYNLTIST